ncbi:MAG: YceI family protein [Calditrichaeota bacterium]|nr:YceI family protein [Calditrichota bacterium]MCB9369434.1 YceI family protein [Calditrichota bacterium]
MKTLVLIATLILLAGSSQAENTKFSLEATGGKQLVQFVSNAALEKIVGKASEMSGTLSVDLQKLTSNASGSVSVDMRSLDTGLSLRNQHMRVNHLNTDEYPYSTFTLKSIVTAEPPDISAGGTSNTLIRGTLELRGVKKDYEMLGTLSYDPALNVLTAYYKWNLFLMDHGMVRPDFLFMKLAEKQEITVELQFTK